MNPMTPPRNPDEPLDLESLPLSHHIFDKLFWPSGRPARDTPLPADDAGDQSATVAE